MPDREKVIMGLEQFITDFKPFCGNKADWQKIYDALALLKAQEPVAPRTSRGWYKCGACGNGIATILDNGEPSHKERYCNLCGRAVKWE